MEFWTKFKEEMMERLAGRLAVVAISVLGSGLLGFKFAQNQDKEELKRQVKEEVIQEIRPALDSAASKAAQIFFLMDQVVTPEQRARASANFNQAKVNLGIK